MKKSSLYINLDNFEFTSCKNQKEYQRICYYIFEVFEKLKKSDKQNFTKLVIGNCNKQSLFYTGVEKAILDTLEKHVAILKEKIKNTLGMNFIDTWTHQVVKIKNKYLGAKSVTGIIFHNFLINEEISENGKNFIKNESSNPTFIFYMFDVKDIH